MGKLDFWYEFASTYSYLTAMRVETVAAEAGIDVRWRPFLLGPIFQAHGMDDSPFNIYPVKGAYMWRDMARQAARLGVPFRLPASFPQNGLLAARVAISGGDADWVRAFSKGIYQAEFVDCLSISDVVVISNVLQKCGQDADAVLAKASSDQVKAKLRAGTDEAAALGIFGAPSFTTNDGELFWGNDRLEQALEWARKND